MPPVQQAQGIRFSGATGGTKREVLPPEGGNYVLNTNTHNKKPLITV
jgi:hypothetical protein